MLVLRTAGLAEGIAVVRSWTEVLESRWLWVTVVLVVVLVVGFVEWARWREEGGEGEGRKGEEGDLSEYCCCS